MPRARTFKSRQSLIKLKFFIKGLCKSPLGLSESSSLHSPMDGVGRLTVFSPESSEVPCPEVIQKAHNWQGKLCGRIASLKVSKTLEWCCCELSSGWDSSWYNCLYLSRGFPGGHFWSASKPDELIDSAGLGWNPLVVVFSTWVNRCFFTSPQEKIPNRELGINTSGFAGWVASAAYA